MTGYGKFYDATVFKFGFIELFCFAVGEAISLPQICKN